MRRQDFAYDLPAELIAQEPPATRSAGRLLLLDGASGAIADRTLRDLPECLRPGDLLVLNDTRVIAARLFGTKPSGGRVEILLERALAGHEALVQLAANKPIRAGLAIATAGGTLQVLAREGELWRVALPAAGARVLRQLRQRAAAALHPPRRRRPPTASATRASSRASRARWRRRPRACISMSR